MYHYENTQSGTIIQIMTGSWGGIDVLAVVMLALGEKEAAIVLGVITAVLAVINGIVFVLFHS